MAELDQATVVENREYHYDTLFQGELPYEVLPEEAEVGIAGLCRVTYRRGPRDEKLSEHLSQLPQIVGDILFEHDVVAKAGEPAIFSFVNAESRERVTAIVSDIFTQWEVTHHRQKLGALVPDKRSEAKWLVIETAAATVEALTATSDFNLTKNTRDGRVVAGMISNWGPKFAEQWFDKTILKQWMAQEGLEDEEQAEWLSVFTPGLLKRFAAYYTADPLRAFTTVKYNLEIVLTDQNIASHLQWAESDVTEMVKPGLRKLLAVGHINNPLSGLERINHNLEEVLTDAAIAQRFGLSEAEAAILVPPSMRKRFAVNNIADPLKACEQWIEGEVPVNPRADTALVNKLERIDR